MPLSDPNTILFCCVALELELRRKNGTGFQDFFATVMEKAHGDDYVRVRAFGQLGDKGCDGYLASNGEVFACYGALDADQNKVKYLIGKMEEDFDKAKKDLSTVLKAWSMVHNFVDGLPVEAVQKLDELKTANPSVTFSFFGRERFEKTVLGLEELAVTQLLGQLAGTHQVNSLQPEELRQMLAAVADEASQSAASTAVNPVPVDKMEFNDIPAPWRSLLLTGYQNTWLVANYLNGHPDSMLGEKLAAWFRGRYETLKSQILNPGEILSALHEFVAGKGVVAPARQVTAQATLAYFFERCDIFEDRPEGADK